MPRPKKYHHIDFSAPKEVADRAKKGLSLRREFERGGTEVGVARARDLKNQARLSPETITRMKSYFSRHQSDKDAENFGDQQNPSAGYVAWLLWGGDPGRDWAQRIAEEMEKADEKAQS